MEGQEEFQKSEGQAGRKAGGMDIQVRSSGKFPEHFEIICQSLGEVSMRQRGEST